MWGSSSWVVVGPAYTAATGSSGANVWTLSDGIQNHVVVKMDISGYTVGVFSQDSFVPATPLTGFPKILPGLNLINTANLAGTVLNGTSTNTLAINSISSSSFLRSDQNSSNGTYTLGVGKLQAGSDLIIDPTPSNEVQIYSNGTTTIKDLAIYVNKGSTQTRAITVSGTTGFTTFSSNIVAAGGILPQVDNTIQLGTSIYRFANVISVNGSFNTLTAATLNAGTVYGNLVGSVSGGTNSSLAGSLTVNTGGGATAIVNGAGSGVGNIGTAGNPFNTVFAKATSAQYADVAERFEADVPMVPGTVVELGGIKEITQAVQELSEAVFGVISTLPGFLLNGTAGSDDTHPAVAVNGRVPVRVVGQVNKGDRLVSAGRGLARAALRSEMTAFNVIGRALENKTTNGEGMIEAIVKLNS